MSVSEKLFEFSKSKVGNLIVGLAFGKLARLLPVKRVRETDKVLAFWHPKPFWEQHILIVPRKPIRSLISVDKSDLEYVDEVFLVAKEIIKELGWQNDEYSLSVNGGKRQKVKQLHFHLSKGDLRK